MKQLLILTISFFIVAIISCTKEKTPQIIPVDPSTFITDECPDTIKFATDLLPTFENKCFGCHNGGNPNFKDYQTVALNADQILKALKGDGAQLMPQGGPALDSAYIQKFKCWINQGKLNN